MGAARNVISGNAEGVDGHRLDDDRHRDRRQPDRHRRQGRGLGRAISAPASILAGGTATTIGGTTALARNVISGNDGDGIDVASGVPSTLIEGNYIGVDQTGTKPLGNSGDGHVGERAIGVTIGGTAQGAGNVISANTEAGVSIAGWPRPGSSSWAT